MGEVAYPKGGRERINDADVTRLWTSEIRFLFRYIGTEPGENPRSTEGRTAVVADLPSPCPPSLPPNP